MSYDRCDAPIVDGQRQFLAVKRHLQNTCKPKMPKRQTNNLNNPKLSKGVMHVCVCVCVCVCVASGKRDMGYEAGRECWWKRGETCRKDHLVVAIKWTRGRGGGRGQRHRLKVVGWTAVEKLKNFINWLG